MKKNIAIVGCGIVGLLISYKFLKLGHKVTIFEKEEPMGLTNCSTTAAGMLSPYCELIHSDKKVFDLGSDSIYRWKKIINELEMKVYFKTKGSLIVANKEHVAELDSICSRTNKYTNANIKIIKSKRISALEPDIDSDDLIGLLFKEEGQIDCKQIINILINFLQTNSCSINFKAEVKNIQNNSVILDNNKKIKFDHVIECAGLHSLNNKRIRAVRGEIIEVHAPEIKISRPIRLNHFRYPVYIAPRENGTYLIGATEIESEDFSPVSIRSAIELLNSSIVISKRFSEARIITLSSNCRPAYSDNLPKIIIRKDYISANGLFRHGYLLSPLVADLVVDYCLKDKKDKNLDYIYN